MKRGFGQRTRTTFRRLLGAFLTAVGFSAAPAAVAQIDLLHSVRAWRDDGWPGGDAEMRCNEQRVYFPGAAIIATITFRAEIRRKHVSIKADYNYVRLDQITAVLTETGFEVAGRMPRGSGRKNKFTVDFREGVITVAADGSGLPQATDYGRTRVECEVIEGPEFPEAAVPEVDIRSQIAARAQELMAPPPIAPPPPGPYVAPNHAGIADAARRASDDAAALEGSDLSSLSHFTETAAGRAYARSPSGRAVALGWPRESCPAVGVSKQALRYSGVAAALDACFAGLAELATGRDCGCEVVAVGDVSLAGPAEFDFEARPALLLATAAENGEGLRIWRGSLAGDPGETRGLRIFDEAGREMCSGVRVGEDAGPQPFDAHCFRFGATYRMTLAPAGVRFMRLSGALVGLAEDRAGEARDRVLVAFFNLDDDALYRIEEEIGALFAP